MNEYEYRAWIPKEKIMVNVEAIDFESNIIYFGGRIIDGFLCNQKHEKLDNIILMRSVLIKNDKRYFERDKISVTNPNGDYYKDTIIYFSDEAGALVVDLEDGDYDITTVGWAIKDGFKFKIIGNDFERTVK